MILSVWLGADLRPTITRLVDEYRVNPENIAIFADVPKKTIQEMINGEPVHKEEAQKVLEELSWLLQTEVTFNDVYVPLIEENNE